MPDLTRFKIGAMYRVPWSPNPHRLEAIKPQYCQMHGELIGTNLHFRKRRNSETRPWGSIAVSNPIDTIQPWEAAPCS